MVHLVIGGRRVYGVGLYVCSFPDFSQRMDGPLKPVEWRRVRNTRRRPSGRLSRSRFHRDRQRVGLSMHDRWVHRIRTEVRHRHVRRMRLHVLLHPRGLSVVWGVWHHVGVRGRKRYRRWGSGHGRTRVLQVIIPFPILLKGFLWVCFIRRRAFMRSLAG